MSDSKFTFDPEHPVDLTEEPKGFLAYLARVFWMVGGKTILFMSAFFIAENFHPYINEVIYWLMVLALIGVRYLDIKRFKGQTCAGRPADMGHWRRYTIGLLLISSVLFALALFAEYQRWLW